MRTPDPDRSLGFLLNDVSRLMRRNLNRRVQALGLTQSQWRALAYLSRQEGINQATLADTLEVQPITLARLIDRLEAAGWVERRRHPSDRRAVRLFLTEKAQPVLSEMWDLASETREEAIAGMPAELRDQLIKALCHMKRNLIESGTAARRTAQPEKANVNANA